MFEQSILPQEHGASKTRAMAASFAIQTMIVSAALLIPLIFSDRLPKVSLFTTLTLPTRTPEPPPVHTSAAPAAGASILHSTPRVFVPNASARPIPSTALILTDNALSPAVSYDTIGIPGGIGNALPQIIGVAAPKTVVKAKAAALAPPVPQRVGGDVQAAKLIRKVMPVYPPMAKIARYSGTVKLAGVIAKDGTVERLDVISGSPLLIGAALDAVKQWVYRPTLLNGEPVEVITEIDVNFTVAR